jgi:hypothetical protein
VKRIAETLGVARSILIERATDKRPKRGPQTRAGDGELAADIRHRHPAKLWIPADRRAPQARAASPAGLDPVNAKRVYRLMKKDGLWRGRPWEAGDRIGGRSSAGIVVSWAIGPARSRGNTYTLSATEDASRA